jgi:hypothetical protein
MQMVEIQRESLKIQMRNSNAKIEKCKWENQT